MTKEKSNSFTFCEATMNLEGQIIENTISNFGMRSLICASYMQK
jgi:hypothetical protein